MPRFPARNLQSRQRSMHLRIDGSAVSTTAGSAGLDEGANLVTIAKGSGGASNEVTITFADAFARAPVIQATPVTTNCHIEIKSVSTSSVVLETFQVADGTTGVNDADMHVTITGWDSSTQWS